jgi:uncharacterized iron-regulated membrane protein
VTARALWLKAHLWIGLAIGAPLVVVALTGAILVFEDGLDRALNPRTSYVPDVASGVRPQVQHPLPIDDLVAKAKAAFPATQLSSISFPESPDLALQIGAGSKSTGPITIAIDQYTGEVLGIRSAAEREAGLARRIHLLHTRLFAGQVGEWIVGLITALTLFMAIAGLVLWWPRKIVSVKWTASGRRVNFDLHNVFGCYASAVFLFIALTGMMISFERWTDPLFMRLNDAPVPQLPRESNDRTTQPIRIETLTSAAAAALPGAFLKGIGIPNGGNSVIVAMMKYPEDRTPGGRSRVALDQHSARVLTVINTRTAPAGARLVNLKRSAHTGDIFGAATRALYFVTCVMLAGQVLTGFLIWIKRPALKSRAD